MRDRSQLFGANALAALASVFMRDGGVNQRELLKSPQKAAEVAEKLFIESDNNLFWTKAISIKKFSATYVPSCTIHDESEIETVIQALPVFTEMSAVCFERSFLDKDCVDVLFYREMYDNRVNKNEPTYLKAYWMQIGSASLAKTFRERVASIRKIDRIGLEFPEEYDADSKAAKIGRMAFYTVSGTSSVVRNVTQTLAKKTAKAA